MSRLSQNGHAIIYVKEPTEEIRRLARKQLETETYWINSQTLHTDGVPISIKKYEIH